MADSSESSPEPPIQDMGSIDIVGKRKDGGVDLFIVVSSRLGPSAEHQRLLLDKIANYLTELNTPEFQSEFGHPPPEKVKVVVSCCVPPDPVIGLLVEKCRPWVSANNAALELQVKN